MKQAAQMMIALAALATPFGCADRRSSEEQENASPLAAETDAAQFVRISDQALRAAVEATHRAPHEIRRLSARDLGIRSLEGIGVLAQLEVLDVSFNEIQALDPVTSLRNLIYLDVTANLIEDLGPLRAMTRLQLLTLDANRIFDISPLLAMPALESVEVSANPITQSQIDALSRRGVTVGYRVAEPKPQIDVPQWTEAQLAPLRLQDPNLLAYIKREFRISGVEQLQVRHVEGVYRLTIDLKKEGIGSLRGLEQLPKLQILTLTGDNGTDIDALRELSSLTTLSLEGMGLMELDFLAGLGAALTSLHLADNQLDDEALRHLADQVELRTLDLARNRIRGPGLSALGRMKAMTSLDLSGNQIHDISGLANMENLEVLLLGENQLSDISVLGGAQRLQTLCLSHNEIRDLTPLQRQEDVRVLAAAANRIDDLSPLAGMKRLLYLNVSRNGISDLTPLTTLTGMRYLSIASNVISTIKPIMEFRHLLSFAYLGNPLTPHAVTTEIPTLEANSPNGPEVPTRLGSGWQIMPRFCRLAE